MANKSAFQNPFAQNFFQNFSQNPFNQGFADFSKFTPDFGKGFAPQAGVPSFDFNKIFSVQRRNVEALTEASQNFAATSQELARKQMDALRSSFEQAMNASREIMTSKSPETNIARQAELAKELYEDAMANLREISEAATKTSFDAYDRLQRRAAESISEIQSASGIKN